MPIHAILGATGNTGSAVLRSLLSSSEIPDLTINILVRSKAKLLQAFPQLAEARTAGAGINIFEGPISNEATLAACLRGASTIYVCVSTNHSGHKVEIAHSTAIHLITALSQLRKAQGPQGSGPDYKPPVILFNRSLSLSTEVKLPGPGFVKSFFKFIIALIYEDLERASMLYKAAEKDELLTCITVDGPTLMDGEGTEPTGYKLMQHGTSSWFLGYADFGKAMVEIGQRCDEFEGKAVAVSATESPLKNTIFKSLNLRLATRAFRSPAHLQAALLEPNPLTSPTAIAKSASMVSISGKVSHYNDWPNAQGVSNLSSFLGDAISDTLKFDVKYEELEPSDLEVSGNIPAYCAGVLFRNGLGPRELQTDKNKTYRTNHWFDCLAQVHRFQIHAPTTENPQIRVTHNSRQTCDGVIKQIMKTGNRRGFSFAAKYDPCMSFFQKVQSVFMPLPKDTIDNVNISVTLSPNYPGFSKIGEKQERPHDSTKTETLFNKTDSSLVQALDPETLEPIGIARQTTLHPDLKGPTSAAHSKVCPITGDVYNYNLEFGGRNGTYRVFRVSASTGKCSILATFPGRPAYLHSLFLTENYVMVCVWNSHFSAGGVSILWTRNYLDAISDFDASKPATWYVIDRKGGKGLIATYESDPFFCFHTINAYEEPSRTVPGATDIIADLCAYDNLDVLKRFYLENLLSDSASAAAYADPRYASAKADYRRFRLPGIPSAKRTKNSPVLRAEMLHRGAKGLAPELPSLNHATRGSKHRFVYGVLDTGKSTFFDGLVKYDTDTLAPCATWSVFAQSAGEPIFVKDPERPEEEDAGVLLTVVLDGVEGRSYLLVLDAKDLKELGRASLRKGPKGVVGFGFHGAMVQAQSTSEGC